MERDRLALKIVDSWESYGKLIRKIGMKLPFEKLYDQKEQAVRDALFKAYGGPEESAKLRAAFEIKSLMDEEALTGKKITAAQVYRHGLQPEKIAQHAREHQKLKVFEGLAEADRPLFLLLDKYDDKCREANRLYALCLKDIQARSETHRETPGETLAEALPSSLQPWDSSSWPAYQDACKPRNKLALEIFDRSQPGKVASLAQVMGLNLKEVDGERIFLRSEQAERDSRIQQHLAARDPEEKGQTAVALLQLIELEQASAQSARPSPAARQTYYAGIDLPTLRETAFAHHRESFLKSLTGEKEVSLFHALQAYETASQGAKKIYAACAAEGKAQSLKPWETERFSAYRAAVERQDEIAGGLLKAGDYRTLEKIGQALGISLQTLDVEAHRHFLRGDPANLYGRLYHPCSRSRP